MINDLSATAVSQALSTRWLGQTCQFLPEVDSTNDLLKQMVQQGTETSPPAGFILLADYQRQGRGRLARRWDAPPGSALLPGQRVSVSLELPAPAGAVSVPRAALVQVAAGAMVYRAGDGDRARRDRGCGRRPAWG